MSQETWVASWMGHESNGIVLVSGSLLLSAVKLTLHCAALDVLSGQAQAPQGLQSVDPLLVEAETPRGDKVVMLCQSAFSREDGWNVLANCRVEEFRSWLSMAEQGRYFEHQAGSSVDHERDRLQECL